MSDDIFILHFIISRDFEKYERAPLNSIYLEFRIKIGKIEVAICNL